MIHKVVAVMSGGPDSVSYAALWKARSYEVHPLVFDYGQKGAKEISVAKRLSKELGFEAPVVVDISFMAKLWKGTQLTDKRMRVKDEYSPSVIVPLRNGVFLMVASAYAHTIGADRVIYGAHLNDVSPQRGTVEPLYPDCTPAFSGALEQAVALGHFSTAPKVEIWSPAREGLTKAALLKEGFEALGDRIYETWSCYLSAKVHCGKCESCRNRMMAFEVAGLPDKTVYAVKRGAR